MVLLQHMMRAKLPRTATMSFAIYPGHMHAAFSKAKKTHQLSDTEMWPEGTTAKKERFDRKEHYLQHHVGHAVQQRAARAQPAQRRQRVARGLMHALRAILVYRQNGRAGGVPVHHCTDAGSACLTCGSVTAGACEAAQHGDLLQAHMPPP